MKKFVSAMVPLSSLRGHRCAWKGCTATTPIEKPLPHDWRWLMLWWLDDGEHTFSDILAHADRDAVLCPKHAAKLHNELLEDIGQRLDQTEGSA